MMREKVDYKKILIIKPSSLGDIIHSLPVLDVLSKSFPGAEIHWLVAKGFEAVLEGHPMLEKVWVVRKDEWKSMSKIRNTITELRGLVKSLKAEKFDLVIDLQGLLRSGLISKATSSMTRVGFKEAREGSAAFYTHKVKGGKDIHAVDRYLRIPAFLGCDVGDVRFPMHGLSVVGEGSPYGTASGSVLPAGGEYAVMAPGARGPAKRWPAKSFGKLASLLPLKTVVIGSKSDKALAGVVVEASAGNAVSVAGNTDLRQMTEIIKGARFVIGNDTGAIHVAAALGIPVFALFGPTNPVRTGPYGQGHTVIRKVLQCSPCYRKTCKNAICLDMITAEEVAGVINSKEELWRRKSRLS